MRIPALLIFVALLGGCAKRKCIGSTCTVAPGTPAAATPAPVAPASKLGFGGDVQAGSATVLSGAHFSVHSSVFGGQGEAFRSTSAHFALEGRANVSR